MHIPHIITKTLKNHRNWEITFIIHRERYPPHHKLFCAYDFCATYYSIQSIDLAKVRVHPPRPRLLTSSAAELFRHHVAWTSCRWIFRSFRDIAHRTSCDRARCPSASDWYSDWNLQFVCWCQHPPAACFARAPRVASSCSTRSAFPRSWRRIPPPWWRQTKLLWRQFALLDPLQSAALAWLCLQINEGACGVSRERPRYNKVILIFAACAFL